MKTVKSNCDDGQRSIANIPNDKCIIVPRSGEMLYEYNPLLSAADTKVFIEELSRKE